MPECKPRPLCGKPLLITQGDAAGVGPEICAACAVKEMINPIFAPIAILGSAALLKKASRYSVCESDWDVFDSIPIISYRDFSAQQRFNSPVVIVDFDNIDLSDHAPGRICAQYGQASFDYIKSAIDWTLSGLAAGVVTGPIHKVALHLAGVPFPGHTEMFAHYTQSDKICMVLSSSELTTALVTAHVGYYQVPELITTQRVWDTLEVNRAAWRKILGREPRFTVCGLNPHAGENGLFGHREEETAILPAVEKAKEAGYNIIGSIPPDTAFIPARRKQTDVYICMYHDQGLIPLKALGFDSGINITLGLPIVRTSVDHGTAIDIAFGSTPGVKPSTYSMNCAIEFARKLA